MPPSEQGQVTKDLTFQLSEPFKYAHKGQARDAQFVVLTGPTSKHRAECAVMKQAFFRALKSAPQSASAEAKAAAPSPQDIKGEDVVDMLYMSDVDMGAVLEAARRLFSGGVAQVDGEEKLTAALIDSMSQEDFERMVGDYLAFFILKSALTRLSAS